MVSATTLAWGLAAYRVIALVAFEWQALHYLHPALFAGYIGRGTAQCETLNPVWRATACRVREVVLAPYLEADPYFGLSPMLPFQRVGYVMWFLVVTAMSVLVALLTTAKSPAARDLSAATWALWGGSMLPLAIEIAFHPQGKGNVGMFVVWNAMDVIGVLGMMCLNAMLAKRGKAKTE